MVADALSTILFVAGMKKGLEYLRTVPQTEAIFVDSNLRVYITSGLRYHFQAEDELDVKILD
jgi:thiamine biosynthesis lipoprotein